MLYLKPVRRCKQKSLRAMDPSTIRARFFLALYFCSSVALLRW